MRPQLGPGEPRETACLASPKVTNALHAHHQVCNVRALRAAQGDMTIMGQLSARIAMLTWGLLP